jgi:hypothetical protein
LGCHGTRCGARWRDLIDYSLQLVEMPMHQPDGLWVIE